MLQLFLSLLALLFFSCQHPQQKEVVLKEDPKDSTDVLIPISNSLINADYHPHFVTLFKNDEYKKWNYNLQGRSSNAGCSFSYLDSIPVWGGRNDYLIKNASHTIFRPYTCKSFLISRDFFIPKNSTTLSIKLRGLFNAYDNGSFLDNRRRGPGKPTSLTVRQIVHGDSISNSFVISDSEVIINKKRGKNWVYPLEIETLKDYSFEQELNPKTESIVIEIENKGEITFAIERLDLLVDGVPIEQTKGDSMMRISRTKYDQFQNNVSDKLALKKDWKIIGIGESIHGSSTFRENFNSIIRHAIQKGDIELLLLEAKPMDGYEINQYVMHKCDTLNLNRDELGYLASPEWVVLFNEIRAANSKRSVPIQVAGFDTPLNMLFFFYELKSLGIKFGDLVKKEKHIFIQSLLPKLVGDSLMVKGEVKRSKEDLFWFEYMYRTLSFVRNGNQDFSGRDERMAENAVFLIDQIAPKGRTYIFSHISHLEKSHSKNIEGGYCMGYYMEQKFGNKYAVIGQFASEGDVLYLRKNDSDSILNIINVAPLQLPVNKSIELLSQTIDKESFYVQGWQDSDWTTSVNYRRMCGNLFHFSQFEPFSLSSIDAFYFTRKNKALKLLTKTTPVVVQSN